MRSKFDEQLQVLNREMIEMGQKIVKSIARSIEALTDKNVELAQRIMESDIEIDLSNKLDVDNVNLEEFLSEEKNNG